MTGLHWAAAYIGLPYSRDATGPREFNCWSFFRHVQSERYGRDLPEIPHPHALFPLVRTFETHAERARWFRVAAPQDGDAVLMRRGRVPIHVGIWIGDVGAGGILHCAEGSGVVFQRLDALRFNGFEVEGYYRFQGDT